MKEDNSVENVLLVKLFREWVVTLLQNFYHYNLQAFESVISDLILHSITKVGRVLEIK